MGDISIIARRLSDGFVQHGWSGNGGYFKTVGARLLRWYDSPEMVEYLFGLGQLRNLWEPRSEEGPALYRTFPTGMPHWVSQSERSIFSNIAFIDYGYFYDADHVWYYVAPGPFRIKLPMTLVEENLDEELFEFSFLKKLERLVLDEIFSGNYAECLERSGYGQEALQKAREELSDGDSPLYALWDRHRRIFDCFDDWVVVRPDKAGTHIGEIVLRPRGETHVETVFW